MARNRIGVFGMLGGLCSLLLAAGQANAAVINVPADHLTIQAAIDASSAGDTIMVAAGTYNESVSVLGKSNLSIIGAGAGSTSIVGPHNSGGSNTVGIISSPGTTLAGFTITRSGNNSTDWATNVKSYGINMSTSNNSVIRDNVITGNRNGFYMENCVNATVRNNVVDDNRTGMHLVAGNTNCTVVENVITNNWTMGVLFRTESVSNDTTGSVFRNNNISGNWYAQIEYREDFTPMGKNFSGNWLGTTSPVVSSICCAEPGYAGQIPSHFPGGSATAPGGQPDVRGDGTDVDQFDITPLLESGTDTNVETVLGRGTNGFQGSFTSVTVTPALAQTGATGRVQEGVNSVTASTVNVLPGTYDEDVAISLANTQLLGAGSGVTTIRGVQGGDNATIRVSANNVTVAGLTITRLGNNTTDWNDPNLNSAGVALIGTALTGLTVRDCFITGNRTGIDINNSSGHIIRNNQINFNRTGLIFRNQTDNLTIVENEIFDNWTVGIVFLDASSGSNVPVQTALNCNISNNNISGNWYGQIVDRQTGGSLPAPGANLKNFSGNWWGTTAPVISAANSAEPGYAAQIPVAYGGTAVPPGGQPDILGPASANFDITPMLENATDTDVETVLGRGTNGFQGDLSEMRVTPQLAQIETGGRIQEGITRVTNSTVYVDPGTFTEVVNLNKVGVKVIGSGIGSTIINYQGFTQPGGFNGGVYSQTNDVELRDLTVTRTVAGGAGSSNPRYGIKFDFASNMIIDNVQVTNSYRSGLDLHGVIDATVNDVSSTGNGGAGIFCTDVKGCDFSNITTSGNPWVGVSVATSGQHTTYGTNDIVFSGTNSFGESAGNNGGLQLEAFEFAPVAPPGINPITWSSNPADGAMVTIQSADFGYALSGALFTPNYIYFRFYQSLAQAQAAAAGTPDHIIAGSRYIQEADDSNGLPNSGPTDLYVYDNAGDTMSIQAAIGGASTTDTDTVNIGAGIYLTGADTTARSIIVSAGASPAQVAITGNMTLDSDDTLPIEIDGPNPATQFDNFIVNGVVTLGDAELDVIPGFTPPNNSSYLIISNDSNDAVVGTFAGKPEGAVFTDGGEVWKITYVGGDGNDVVLIAQEAGTLTLAYDQSCYQPGSTLTATLSMSGLTQPAAGFQAFLEYDPSRLTFVSWTYTAAPFGLPVLNTAATVNPGGPSSGILNLASGINQLGGQTPSMADALLVTMTFTISGPDACPATIDGLLTFRTHNPPTRLTDINGQPLAALTLEDSNPITVDGTVPSITCSAGANFQCASQVPAVDINSVTASDACSAVVVTHEGDALVPPVPTCPNNFTLTRTYRATDACGNFAECTQVFVVLDDTDPDITCPANVVVSPPAGVCSAVGVVVGTATAIDNCTASPAIVGVRSDALPLTDPYPQGVTTITWTATDECGNDDSCMQTVTVESVTISVAVELSPTMDIPPSLTRCITFVVYDCVNNTTTSIDQVLTFSLDEYSPGFFRALATGNICVPSPIPSSYTCVTARDKLHSLRSKVELGDGLMQTGLTTYTADFTGKRGGEPPAIPVTPGSGHRLVGGNLNDDIFIDILDFGTWAGLYNLNPVGNDYASGNTTCATLSPHADITGNAEVDSGDFSFIALNFLMVAENNCCSMSPITDGGIDDPPMPHNGVPRASISVAELVQMGMGHLVAGDVNNDGMLDQADMAAVFSGTMPTPHVKKRPRVDVDAIPNPDVPVAPVDPTGSRRRP